MESLQNNEPEKARHFRSKGFYLANGTAVGAVAYKVMARHARGDPAAASANLDN
jgi:hypothetical protein